MLDILNNFKQKFRIVSNSVSVETLLEPCGDIRLQAAHYIIKEFKWFLLLVLSLL